MTDMSPQTLLLLSSSPITRTFFTEMDGHSLISARTESEALDYLDKTSITFIVIDEKALGKELIPFCEKIRSLPSHQCTPVLIITGHLKKTFTRSLLKAGATEFLREPLDEDEFLHRMEMAILKVKTEKKIASLIPIKNRNNTEEPS